MIFESEMLTFRGLETIGIASIEGGESSSRDQTGRRSECLNTSLMTRFPASATFEEGIFINDIAFHGLDIS